jgi:type IV pilus assembly protein PilM
MQLLKQLARVVQDPPPEYIFEISEAGIAWARRGAAAQAAFQPLEADVLSVSPLKDNVLRPDALAEAVKGLADGHGAHKRRRAALILPDYSARVAVFDFDGFPNAAEEQESLVRFRMKKAASLDVDSAAVSFQAQPRAGGKHYDVVVAIIPLETVARYEAPFRAAGFQPGVVTTSALAALELVNETGLSLSARLSGRVISVCVNSGNVLRLMRTVELPEVSAAEVMSILYPTVAFMEDDLGGKPGRMFACGFGAITEDLRAQCEVELGLALEPLRSRFGVPGQNNAGLLGYLESIEG